MDQDCGQGWFCGGDGRCVASVVAVAAGTSHSCAVHGDGRVSCWGYGAFIAPDLPTVTPPVSVPAGGRALALAVGIEAACALIDGGAVSCWGKLGGRLERAQPVVLEDGSMLFGVTALAGGSLAFCGLTERGTFCWGDNTQSELGRPADQSWPPLTAVLAHPGRQGHLAATVAVVVHDGKTTLCGWGNNERGLFPGPRGLQAVPVCEEGLGEVTALSAGDGHVCAERGARRLLCWGSNSGGQLATGDERVVERPLPGQEVDLPGEVVTVASGAYHVCALLAQGQTFCWGSNERGECGVSPSAPRFSPTALAGRHTFVGLGAGAGAQHTCGIRSDGRVACWGYDHRGQLGSGVVTENEDRFSAEPLLVRF